MARDVPMRNTYHGVMLFVASDLTHVVVLLLFPGITLFILKLI